MAIAAFFLVLAGGVDGDMGGDPQALRRAHRRTQAARASGAEPRVISLARHVQPSHGMTATIRDYMTPAPFTIGVDQPLSAAAEVMRAHHIRHLPVLRGGTLVGVVSDRDVQLVSSLGKPADLHVEDAMTELVYAVSPDASIGEVTAEMAAHKYGSALVTEGGHVVGIFTTIDALHALTDALSTQAPKRRAAGRR